MPITPALVPEAADTAKERTFPFWDKGGNVCNRRNLAIAARSGDGLFTIRFPDLHF